MMVAEIGPALGDACGRHEEIRDCVTRRTEHLATPGSGEAQRPRTHNGALLHFFAAQGTDTPFREVITLKQRLLRRMLHRRTSLNAYCSHNNVTIGIIDTSENNCAMPNFDDIPNLTSLGSFSEAH